MNDFIQTIRLLVVTFLLMFTFSTSKSQVVVTMKLDSVNILIGQQVQLSTSVLTPKEQNVEFPVYQAGDSLIKGIEVVSQIPQQKRKQDDGKIVYEKKYLITAFDSAIYHIPAIEVLVDGERCKATKGLTLSVNTVPVDTANVDNFAGPNGTVATAFVWNHTILMISILAWLFVILFFVLSIPFLTKKVLTKRKKVIEGVAPFKQASKELDEIVRNEDVYKHDKFTKSFYMNLTDTLRRYLYNRYGCRASEMTTDEILSEINDKVEKSDVMILKSVFETADLAKFAKYETSFYERESHVKKVLSFLSNTKDESLEHPKPTIEIVVLNDGIQRRYRLCLILGLLLSVLGCVIVLYYVLSELVQVYSY